MNLICLRAEKFDEAFFDFRVALLELVGVSGEQFQLLELRFIGRIGDFGMPRVESLLIRQ